MPDFSQLFQEANWEPISFEGHLVALKDAFPVRDGDHLMVSIESSNGQVRQGLCIEIAGSCEFAGRTFDKGKSTRIVFWEDTAPDTIDLLIHTKQANVWIENIWERTSPTGRTYTDSGHYGAAMIVEEIENGRRYRCNDWEPDEDFDDIVFTVQRVPKDSGEEN